MSRQDSARQRSFRSRLLSWASTAPQRGSSQRRQPSRVTTTVASPQAPPDQPSSPPQTTQPRQQLPVSPPSTVKTSAPARRPSQPPPSSPAKPQMGTAPSRPAPAATPTPSQPARRTPSRQLSRTYTQQSPASPPPPPSSQQVTPPRGLSPLPTPPAASPAWPASPEVPKAPSTTPSPAPTPPPLAAARPPPSPPPKAAPSSPPRPAPPVQEITEPPSLPPVSAKTAIQVLHLHPPQPTERKRETEQKEGTTTILPAQPQPQPQAVEASQEDQTPTDSTFMPIEVQSRPLAESGEKPMPTEITTTPQPASGTQSAEETEDKVSPTEHVEHQKQTISDTTEPPKLEREPKGTEEKKPVTSPQAEQESDASLSQTVERKLEEPQEEKKAAKQPEPHEEEDSSRPKDRDTKLEELKKVIPKSSPDQTPDAQGSQIKDSQQTTNGVETKQTPDEEPQIKDSERSQQTTNVVETKPTIEEPPRKPTQIHSEAVQPIGEVDAEPPERQTPPPEKQPPPPPPSGTRAKESKIAISTVARTSTPSREQSGSLHKEIKEGISRLVQNLAVQHSKHPTGTGHGISIITLAGDNQGAAMYVGYGTTSREGSNNVRLHKVPLPNSDNVATAGEDGKKKKTDDKSSNSTPATSASVNSNVQSINNSILHDSSCSEENPGVHLFLSSRPPEHAQPKEMAKLPQIQRSKSRIPLPQKLTYEPNIRRRCLRALFLESSDDDPEIKPQKPRRHGCRFNCDERKKAKGDQDGAYGVDDKRRNGREGVERG